MIRKTKFLIFFSFFLVISIPFVSPNSIIKDNHIQNISLSNYDEDVIIFTANQGWLSRIYILNMEGIVLDYFEYEFYHFVDTEVVNNELYISEAFAPRVYKVDITNGDLEVVVDDWTLYYFYGLAYDGQYFYIDEWDLNRYDINGNKYGMASFDEDVYGSTCDENYYWTLDDNTLIKCWDLTNWPTITQVPDNNFVPPSPNCRGLWFDGENFWTTENIDGSLGYIYKFNYNGDVIDQWLAPAFIGWSACVIKGHNNPPNEPDIPSGPMEGYINIEYTYLTIALDPDGDQLFYQWDWGDGNISEWLGPYSQEIPCTNSYKWIYPGEYEIKTRAKDNHNCIGNWSDTLLINISENFSCGDVDNSEDIDIDDVVYLINYIFNEESGPVPQKCVGDVNGDGQVDIDDVVYLISYIFSMGPPPVEDCCDFQ